MNNYQLIAFDMDGTLLNSDKQISPETLNAIKRAGDAGKTVILCTGRNLAELNAFTEIIPGLRYLDCVSGACVYDLKEKKTLYSQALDPGIVKKLMEFALEEEAMIHVLSERSIVQRNQQSHMADFHMGIYQTMFDKITDKLENIYNSFCQEPFPVLKLNLYHKDEYSRARTVERIKAAGLETALALAESTSLECSAKGIDKGVGLKKLCEHLGLPLEQTIAVGDADNDTMALKTAGLSIAMGNATEPIKTLADVIVADCDHNGCAEAIDKYLLAENRPQKPV